MSLTERITAWLAYPDAAYMVGIELLIEAGGRGIVLRTLQLGENAYNRTRLEAELRQKLHTLPNNIFPIGADIETVVKENSAKQPEQPTSDVLVITTPTADVLRERAYDLMNERSEHKARIRALKDDPAKKEERRLAAYRILEITDQIDEIYYQLEFLQLYGYLPVSEGPKPDLDDAALLKNIRTYVSRYKNKVKRPNQTAEQLEKNTQLLQYYEAEKAALEAKLNRHEIGRNAL